MRLVRTRRVAALAAGAWVLGAIGFVSPVFDGFAHQAEDLLQPGTAAVDDVVVVGIDRRTLADVGDAWPWPRARHAELVDALGAAGAEVIVYDVVFADPRDDDPALVEALARTPTILASALTLAAGDGPPVAVGHANVTLSTRTGVVRSMPFYALDERGVVVPSLTAAAVAHLAGVTGPPIERPDGIQIGDQLVPLDDGVLRLNWADELSRPDAIVSAVDVMAGTVDPALIAGRVVLVGVTEPTIGDLHLIPTDRSGNVPGLLVHANALNTVLGRAFLHEAATGTQLLGLAVVALLTAAVVLRVRLLVAATAMVAFGGGVIAWTAWRFHLGGELWNVVWPLLTILLVGAGAGAWRWFGEVRHRRRAERLFAEYVPDDVLSALSEPHLLEAAVAGRRLEVVVLFCDLRGFTPIAAQLAPDGVRRLLDAYYDYASATIHRHGGTVLQFVGDEVFAVFGAPVPMDGGGGAAMRAAVDLIDGVAALDHRLDAEALPRLRFGVAVHAGPVVSAHVGTSVHRQYAVIGDTVNVGSRLCGLAGAGEIVVERDTVDGRPSLGAESARPFVVEENVILKGVEGSVAVARYRADDPAHAGAP